MLFNQPPLPVIYEIQYMDNVRGAKVTEKLDYKEFIVRFDEILETLKKMGEREARQAVFVATEDKTLIGLLEKTVRELQGLHKTLSALDDFFKSNAILGKMRGIKPELEVVKNALIKANQKRFEYSALQEGEDEKISVATP
jgi:hypothetical protein